MRIEDNQLDNQLGSVSSTRIDQVSTGPQTAGNANRAAQSDQDQVEISSTAGIISTALSSHDASRSARVSEIGALYAGGGYSADSAGISAAMVTDALSRPGL